MQGRAGSGSGLDRDFKRYGQVAVKSFPGRILEEARNFFGYFLGHAGKGPAVGSYQVVVTVTDQTSLVHQAMAGSSLTSSRQWTLNYPAAIFADGFEGGGSSNWSRKVP